MAMLADKPENGGATEDHVAEMEGNEENAQVKLEEQAQELEDVTQARLEAVMSGEGVPESESEPAEDSKDQEDSTPEEKPAEEPDKEDEPTPELEPEDKTAEDGETESKEGKQKEIPSLSDAYYRAALRSEWTPEAIKEFYEASPELCVKTLGKMYEDMNRSSRDYAARGRIKREQTARAAQEIIRPDKGTASEAQAAQFKGIDVKALEDGDADEATIAAFKAINEQNKESFEARQKTVPAQETVQPYSLSQQEVQATNRESAALEQQIDNFITNAKGYEDFYGTLEKGAVDWAKLSPGQRMNRFAVITMTDELMAGAATYGREMKLDDALERAHLSVSESEREKVIRDELKSKLTKRSKSLSLQPSGSAKPEGGKPQTETDLQDVTQQRLNKVFG